MYATVFLLFFMNGKNCNIANCGHAVSKTGLTHFWLADFIVRIFAESILQVTKEAITLSLPHYVRQRPFL